MTKPDIHRIGEALYGPRWQSELAREKGINLRTMQRWAAGQSDAPPSLFIELADDIDARVAHLEALACEIRRYVGKVR